MGARSRKDCLAICGRSGIETLKSRLIQDGYMRALWVLPEYYEPPQFYNRPQPKPELPPFNPQPLIDTFLTTQTLNAGMQFTVDSVEPTVPYAYTSTGRFLFESTSELLPSDVAISAVGTFTFSAPAQWDLVGVAAQGEIGQFGTNNTYGFGGYGADPYGGSVSAGFDVAFFMTSVAASSAVGAFVEGEGFGNDVYGGNGYGGI